MRPRPKSRDQYSIRKISALVEMLALKYEASYSKASKGGWLDDLRATILGTLKKQLGEYLMPGKVEKFYGKLSAVVFDRRSGTYNNNFSELHGERYIRGIVEGLWDIFFTETHFPFEDEDDSS